MSDYEKMLGLGVMSIQEGIRCGKVVDLLIDYRKYEVFGFIVKGGWNKDAEIVLFKDIESIGQDLVMVADAKAVKEAAKVPQALEAIKEHVTIAKLEVISRSGQVLGRIGTFEFDTATGRIEKFEIAGSVLKNIFEGKHVIPVKQIISIGCDAMIVQDKKKEPEPVKAKKAEAVKPAAPAPAASVPPAADAERKKSRKTASRKKTVK